MKNWQRRWRKDVNEKRIGRTAAVQKARQRRNGIPFQRRQRVDRRARRARSELSDGGGRDVGARRQDFAFFSAIRKTSAYSAAVTGCTLSRCPFCTSFID